MRGLHLLISLPIRREQLLDLSRSAAPVTETLPDTIAADTMNLAMNHRRKSPFPNVYESGLLLGRPPLRPLTRDCSLPASDFGPVEQPPCHLQRPLR